MSTIFIEERIGNAQCMGQMMAIIGIIIVCYAEAYTQKIKPEE